MEQRLKRANVQDLDQVRQLLEMKIAELAARNRTDADIMVIKGHLEDTRTVAIISKQKTDTFLIKMISRF